MKRGYLTSEGWIAAMWSFKAALALSALLAFAPANWPIALIGIAPVCLVIYFAGLIAHNFSENRFQLKAQQRAIQSGQSVDGNPGRTFIFGSHVASESEPNSDEED